MSETVKVTYNYMVNQPCQNGHVFSYSGDTTDYKPDPNLRCDCGTFRYGDVFGIQVATGGCP